MTTLRCVCGSRFRVSSDHAGAVITTPCCQRQVRIPSEPPVAEQRDVIFVRCRCLQSIRIKKPTGPVQLQCPNCLRTLRVGEQAELPPNSTVTTTPNLFAYLPPEPRTTQFKGTRPAARPAHPNKPTAAKSNQRQASHSRVVLPRFGFLKEESGAPILFSAAVILFSVFLAIGVYLGRQAVDFRAKVAASTNWEAAPGTIVSSGFKTRLHNGRQYATIQISYRFDVDGSSYTGNTLAFEKLDSMTVGVAEARLKPYPTGASCAVFYDPTSPTNNVLEKGSQGSNTFQMLMAAFFILAGIVCAYDCAAGAVNIMGRSAAGRTN